jgi:hypothetical protein
MLNCVDEPGFRLPLCKSDDSLQQFAAPGVTVWAHEQEVLLQIEVKGTENIPKTGRRVLVGVHRGFMPWDGVMTPHTIVKSAGPNALVGRVAVQYTQARVRHAIAFLFYLVDPLRACEQIRKRWHGSLRARHVAILRMVAREHGPGGHRSGIGLAAAISLSHLLASLLFGIQPRGGVTFVAAALLLVLVERTET